MNLTEKWKKFFCDAGIPATEASTYAFKFSQNRIHINMLADLNKDYLKEMGITLMGDVISILRHSRQVYEEIQKSGKSEFFESPKDVSRKDKEVPKPKKAQIEKPAIQAESKSQAKPTAHASLKRKSEPPIVPAKKRQIETVTKKVIDSNTDNIEECEDLGYVVIDSSKKSFIFNQKLTDSVEKQLKTITLEKKPELPCRDDRIAEISNMSEDDDDDDDDDNIEVIIDEPTPYNGYRKYHSLEKYENNSKYKEHQKLPNLADANKRAVFKRLGEEVPQYSSVSSTTAFEEDDFASKKAKDEIAKLTAEKNSVFQRLGQKCDVSSTSIDSVGEEKKSIISIEFGDTKTNIMASKNKIGIKRKVKTEEKEDPSACLPACVRSTYSEGILGANSSLERKLSLKDRLGNNRSIQDLTKMNYKETSSDLKHRKSYPDDSYSRKSKITTKKRVSFGSVSEKLIPNREEAIKNGELIVAETRVSVFDRLGFNRNY